MEDKGALAFAEMLKVNTTLEDLSLRSESYVGGRKNKDEGRETFTNISHREVFTYMETRRDITFKGAFAIARALWDNFSLTKLGIALPFFPPLSSLPFPLLPRFTLLLV